MNVQESVTIIDRVNERPVKDYYAEPGTLKVKDNVTLALSNCDTMELYAGDNCDITISNCRDITIYCDNDCRIEVIDNCDIEIFAEDNCDLIFSGEDGHGGRIVCRDNCRITCWPCVEIESGDNCVICCDRDCNIECRDSCTIRGASPRSSFEVHCRRNCDIRCNEHSRIETSHWCNITWMDDTGKVIESRAR